MKKRISLSVILLLITYFCLPVHAEKNNSIKLENNTLVIDIHYPQGISQLAASFLKPVIVHTVWGSA